MDTSSVGLMKDTRRMLYFLYYRMRTLMNTNNLDYSQGTMTITHCTVAGWSHFNKKVARAEVLHNNQ